MKTVLLDMDGVLWHGARPVLDIQLLFDRIRILGIQAYCVTNNSTRTADHHLQKLESYGVRLGPSQIITSAEATASFLEKEFPQRGELFLIGEGGIRQALEGSGFKLVEDDPGADVQAVVVGLDQGLVYRDLELAVRYIQQGALFVGTNPDLTIPTPTGEAPGAGAILRAIEVSSGIKPYIIGKPHPALYEVALERADSLPGEALMIGDRLETDILGAQRLGLFTAVVLTGIADIEQAEGWKPRPDLIAADAIQVMDEIARNDGKLI